MKYKIILVKSFVAWLLSVAMIAHAIDNPHFWRATNFLPDFYEPRFACPWLTSFEFFLGFGSTRTALNGKGEKVSLLDIYGTYDMISLGINVPGKNLTNPADIALMELSLLSPNGNFAQLSYRGKFKIIEANFGFTQNLECGFFFQAHLPVRKLTIDYIEQIDLSPTECDSGPTISNPIWQNFLLQFPNILQKYNLFLGPTSRTGAGDLSLLLGWTNNYEHCIDLDYIDTTFRFGLLIPTGQKLNEDVVFSIANGYDGHWSLPISLALAAGWYDWFTLGTFVGVMPFFDSKRELRLRTDCLQSGLIILAKGDAKVDFGTIWEANVYMKADHFLCGWSVLLGYSFAMQNRSWVTPKDLTLFDPAIVNTDPRFDEWKMHTINFLVDWDMARDRCPWRPHLGFFFNFVVGGKRIFDTDVGGFEIGLHSVCHF